MDNNTNIQHFKRKHVSRYNTRSINSVDYRSDGQLLITSADDDTIRLYKSHSLQQTRHSRKYGAAGIKFSHDGETAIFCSTKINHDIRHYDYNKNSFIRYYQGHTKSVKSIAISHTPGVFVSAGLDKKVCFWSSNVPNPTTHMNFDSCQGNFAPRVCLDSLGRTAVALNSKEKSKVYIYARKYLKRPESDFDIPSVNPLVDVLTDFQFSPDGRNLLLSYNNKLVVICAYSGKELKQIVNEHQARADFSGDSKLLVAASNDGWLKAWCVDDWEEEFGYRSASCSDLSALKFHPSTSQFVTTSRNQLTFWDTEFYFPSSAPKKRGLGKNCKNKKKWYPKNKVKFETNNCNDS